MFISSFHEVKIQSESHLDSLVNRNYSRDEKVLLT